MAERKDDFIAWREAKELGPYPSWARWKHALIGRFGDQIPPIVETHLHEWYVIRRRHQLGLIEESQMDDLRKAFSDSHEDLFNDERFISAFKFITEKTTIK